MQNAKCKQCKVFCICIWHLALHASLIRQHALEFGGILIGHLLCATLLALHLRRLTRQDVPLEGAGSDDLARSSLLEALGGAPMCFQFRHVSTRLYSSLAQARSRLSLSARSCGP